MFEVQPYISLRRPNVCLISTERSARLMAWTTLKAVGRGSNEAGAYRMGKGSVAHSECVLAVQVYAAPLADGSRAVVLLNRHTLATQYPVSELYVDWSWLGFPSGAEVIIPPPLLTPSEPCPRFTSFQRSSLKSCGCCTPPPLPSIPMIPANAVTPSSATHPSGVNAALPPPSPQPI